MPSGPELESPELSITFVTTSMVGFWISETSILLWKFLSSFWKSFSRFDPGFIFISSQRPPQKFFIRVPIAVGESVRGSSREALRARILFLVDGRQTFIFLIKLWRSGL